MPMRASHYRRAEKTKKTKAGERDYVYYRCTQYNVKGHPRVRLTEADLDQQVLALFGRLRIEDEAVRDWVCASCGRGPVKTKTVAANKMLNCTVSYPLLKPRGTAY